MREIADDTENDWAEAKNGQNVPNKELVLRSKVRIETRRFHRELAVRFTGS